MRTPSEKSPELVELSDYLTQVSEPGSPEPEDPVESEQADLPRSPYAPKPAHERAALRLRALADDAADPAVSAYAPKRARALERPSSVPADANPLHSTPEIRQGEPTAAPLAHAKTVVSPDKAPPKPTVSEIRRRIMADEELARIEASLRLLQQRQVGAMRLPRGPNVPLPERSANDGNREPAIEWFARPASLEPTLMPPPPAKPGRRLPVGLLLTITCFAGGALAYFAFVHPRSLPPAATIRTTSVAPSYQPRTRDPQSPSRSEVQLRPELYWAEGSVSRGSGMQTELAEIEVPQPNPPVATAMISARHSIPNVEPADNEGEASRANSTVRALGPEEIEVLIEQGQKFIADGDIVTARLIFERAAKADNATAALALAAAYDPIVLAKLGALGVDTDVEKARLWYQKAQSLGSAQAPERLRALAAR